MLDPWWAWGEIEAGWLPKMRPQIASRYDVSQTGYWLYGKQLFFKTSILGKAHYCVPFTKSYFLPNTGLSSSEGSKAISSHKAAPLCFFEHLTS